MQHCRCRCSFSYLLLFAHLLRGHAWVSILIEDILVLSVLIRPPPRGIASTKVRHFQSSFLFSCILTHGTMLSLPTCILSSRYSKLCHNRLGLLNHYDNQRMRLYITGQSGQRELGSWAFIYFFFQLLFLCFPSVVFFPCYFRSYLTLSSCTIC